MTNTYTFDEDSRRISLVISGGGAAACVRKEKKYVLKEALFWEVNIERKTRKISDLELDINCRKGENNE